MKENEIIQVSDFLIGMRIDHEKTDNSILINRDSICKCFVNAKGEQESYDNLIVSLNGAFNSRFVYVAKTDDWLMLDKLVDSTHWMM